MKRLSTLIILVLLTIGSFSIQSCHRSSCPSVEGAKEMDMNKKQRGSPRSNVLPPGR